MVMRKLLKITIVLCWVSSSVLCLQIRKCLLFPIRCSCICHCFASCDCVFYKRSITLATATLQRHAASCSNVSNCPNKYVLAKIDLTSLIIVQIYDLSTCTLQCHAMTNIFYMRHYLHHSYVHYVAAASSDISNGLLPASTFPIRIIINASFDMWTVTPSTPNNSNSNNNSNNNNSSSTTTTNNNNSSNNSSSSNIDTVRAVAEATLNLDHKTFTFLQSHMAIA